MKINKFIYVFLAVLTGLLYCFSGSYPFIVLFGAALCCVAVTEKALYSAVTVAVTLTLSAFLSDTNGILVMMLLCGVLPGILLGIGYRKKLPLQYLTVIPACCYTLGTAFTFFSYKSLNGTNMFDDALGTVSESLNGTLASMAELYGNQIDSELIDSLSEAMTTALSGIKLLIPCIVIIYSSVTALILVWLTQKTARRAGFPTDRGFSEIYAPSAVSLFVSVCLIATFLVNKSSSFFFVNLLVIFLAYYILCGISLGDYYFRKVVPYRAVRALIYAVVFLIFSFLLPQVLWTILMLAGMSDMMFDFRKLRPRYFDFDNEQ